VLLKLGTTNYIISVIKNETLNIVSHKGHCEVVHVIRSNNQYAGHRFTNGIFNGHFSRLRSIDKAFSTSIKTWSLSLADEIFLAALSSALIRKPRSCDRGFFHEQEGDYGLALAECIVNPKT